MSLPDQDPGQGGASSLWMRQGPTPEPADEASPTVPEDMARRMATLREAARQRSLAKTQRRLWFFYLEHSLFDEARKTRLLMLEHLRSAGQQWRSVLGRTQS